MLDEKSGYGKVDDDHDFHEDKNNDEKDNADDEDDIVETLW